MIPLLILLGVLVVLVLWFVGAYNGLVNGRNQVQNAWAQIDVQLKHRHDLIPNLVETAKGYVTHERGTLEAVTNARAAAMKAQGAGQAAQAEGLLGSALSKFFAIAEAYPDLKANQNFLAVQEELSSTENKIGFARQFYNDSVMSYNTKIQSIPTNIVAGVGHFEKAEFFELQDAAQREVPQVKF